jgi:hypothetical protein
MIFMVEDAGLHVRLSDQAVTTDCFPRTARMFPVAECFINGSFKDDLLNHWAAIRSLIGPTVYDVTGCRVGNYCRMFSCGFNTERTDIDLTG